MAGNVESYMDGVLEFGKSIINDDSKVINFLPYIYIPWAVSLIGTLSTMTAPYGRYVRDGFGFAVKGQAAWFLQELPALIAPFLCVFYFYAPRADALPNKILLSLYCLHYIQRTLIFPFFIRGGKPIPFIPFLIACFFCGMNGYLQTRTLSRYANYSENWTSDPRFVTGVVLFLVGMFINVHSDHILRTLRKPGDVGYKIPVGGMFEYVSGANFLGEIIQWSAFALASWSFPAMVFAVFTLCNIGPRAFHHHSYYKKKFENYPKSRKALIPFII